MIFCALARIEAMSFCGSSLAAWFSLQFPAISTPGGVCSLGPPAHPLSIAAITSAAGQNPCADSAAEWPVSDGSTLRILAYPRTMTRRKATQLERLNRRITRLDVDSIDELYGLEPVYEPGTDRAASLAPEEFVAVRCPWCGERLE